MSSSPTVRRAALLAAVAAMLACDKIDAPHVSRTTVRISSTSTGEPASGASNAGDISEDGEWVAFVSDATNLVPDVLAPERHVYVKSRRDGSVRLATRNSEQGDAPVACNPSGVSISADGRYVVFTATVALDGGAAGNGRENIFIRDLRLNVTTRAINRNLWPNQNAGNPRIYRDGRYLVFESRATNISAFNPNVTQIFISDLSTTPPTIDLVSHARGNFAAIANGACTEPSISSSGGLIAFQSQATNIDINDSDLDSVSDVYATLVSGTTAQDAILVSRNEAGVKGNGASTRPHVSQGRITFLTAAPNMGPGPLNIMMRNIFAQTTRRVTVTTSGIGPADVLDFPRASQGERFVAFLSNSPAFTGDTSGRIQPYVARLDGTFEKVAVNDAGVPAGAAASPTSLSISGTGPWVVWTTSAGNLVVPPDVNTLTDIFARGPYGP